MNGKIENPRVFISYSWTSPILEDWVLNLAERLTGDGVKVILDKWDLKEGQDKHVFMEKMVTEKEIKRVLVICDKGYQEKADSRKGGVGTESQLISKEVYEKTDQEKFIPIIKEYDAKGGACVPKFLGSRKYIDLSNDEVFEENYIKLIRNLYDKPELKKPPLGTPPAYITEEGQIELKTSHKVTEIREAIIQSSPSADAKTYDYLDTFIESLEDFKVIYKGEPDFDEKILSNIERMTPLRDDFIKFTYTLFKLKDHIDLDRMHNFFERLISFQFSSNELECDHFKFFMYELNLYFFSILFQLRRFNVAAYLINTSYLYRDEDGELMHHDIKIFNRYLRSLDDLRNKRLKLMRISITADLIKSRAIRPDINFDTLAQTDLIMHYLTRLKCDNYPWFPRTSVYRSRGHIDVFERMISEKHFEQVKDLFEIKSLNELSDKLSKCTKYEIENPLNIDSFNYNIPPLERVINLDQIGKIR